MPRSGPTRFSKTFGLRLQACRIAAGFETAADFASSLGLEGPHYRRWERGETLPTIEDLPNLAKLLGKSIDFLVTGQSGRTDTSAE